MNINYLEYATLTCDARLRMLIEKATSVKKSKLSMKSQGLSVRLYVSRTSISMTGILDCHFSLFICADWFAALNVWWALTEYSLGVVASTGRLPNQNSGQETEPLQRIFAPWAKIGIFCSSWNSMSRKRLSNPSGRFCAPPSCAPWAAAVRPPRRPSLRHWQEIQLCTFDWRRVVIIDIDILLKYMNKSMVVTYPK